MKSIPVFVNKSLTIGRILDDLTQHAGINNANDTLGQTHILRIFSSKGVFLEFHKPLDFYVELKVVISGGSIIIESSETEYIDIHGFIN